MADTVADPGQGMPDPTQSGGPSWGQIAIPADTTIFNPGFMVIGQAAMDQAFNAKRAQNLATFDAYQKMNPGATAADLTQAYEKITGGQNYFGQNVGGTWGNLAGLFGGGTTAPGAGPAAGGGVPAGAGVGTPGGGAVPTMMQSLATKNQMALQAGQAKQQADITSGYTAALDQSLKTARTKEDWLAGAKALLPANLQPGFDQYMAAQNTDQMFQVNQQRLVDPVVQAGERNLWDDPKQYTIALGGNEALGKMAYDLAKPNVDAAKLKNATDIQKTQAEINAQNASAAAERQRVVLEQHQASQADAAARADDARTRLVNQQAAAEQIKANNEQYDTMDKIVSEDAQISQAITSQDPDQLKQAHDRAYAHWKDIYGQSASTDAMFEEFWGQADKLLAGRTSMLLQSQALAASKADHDQMITGPTEGLRAQVGQSERPLALGGIDDAQVQKANLTAQQKTDMENSIISTTKTLLADKNMAISDREKFQQIVAADVLAGKSYSQIVTDLKQPGASGLPVYGVDANFVDALNRRQKGYGLRPVSSMEVDKQVADTVNKALVINNALIRTLTTGGGPATGMGSNVKASIEAARASIDEAMATIDTQYQRMMDPATAGLYTDKRAATLSHLEQEKLALSNKSAELKAILDKRPQLTATDPAVDNTVSVGGTKTSVQTNPAALSQVQIAAMPGKVAAAQAQPGPGAGRFGGAGLGTVGTTLDQRFIDAVHDDPDAARLAALVEQEAVRALQAQTVAAKPKVTLSTMTVDTGPPPITQTKLTPDQAATIVDRVIAANKGNMNQVAVSVMQANLAKFILNEQDQGTLLPKQP